MVLSPEEKKERKRERDRRYREKNKERLAEYIKEYERKNKERLIEYRKEYYMDNREQKIEYNKQYSKEYRKTYNGDRTNKITKWKSRGVINEDFDTLYDLFINTDKCMYCEKVFVDSVDRCLDHDHETGLYRAVLCRSCNVKDVLNPKL